MHHYQYRKIWILLCLISCSHGAFAQECSRLSFSIKNGLAGDNIYSITEDKDGFLWISTETGVSRFDGTEFKNYTIKDGLPSNDVNGVFADSKNRVWMSPFKKEVCYYYNGSIHNKYNDTLLARIPVSSEEKFFSEDTAGTMLMETDSALALIDRQDNYRYLPKPYRGNAFFTPLRINNQGIISAEIITPPANRYSILYSGRKVYMPPVILHNGLAVASDQNKNIIVFDSNGYKARSSYAGQVTTINRFSDSAIIVNTHRGSFIYNLFTGKSKPLLQDFPVNICYKDRESGIWVGTNGAGLFYIPSVQNTSITRNKDNSTLQVSHLYYYNQHLVAGTSNWQFWKLGADNNSLERKLSPDEINTRMLIMPEGNMLKSPENSVVYALLRKKAIQEYNTASKSETCNGDTIHTAIVSGLLYRFLLSGRVLNQTCWNGRLTCSMYIDGYYYTGTLEGLYLLPADGNNHSPADATQLVKGNIYAMAHSLHNDLLWVATRDDGVYCLHKNRIIKHFNTANGLSNNICKCMFTDGENVYIGTMDGLNIIRPGNNFSISSYYTTDGLVSNNINCIYATGNHIWAGTSEGLSYLDISQKPVTGSCGIAITEITVSGRNLPPNTTTMTLAPQDNNIRLAWSGISFRSMGRMKYVYRLRGLSDTWQSTTQRYLVYPSLPSGTYSFDIYAVNRYQIPSKIKTVVFTINKNWWQHWWVQALGVLLLLGLSSLLIWRRAARKQQREQEKIALKEKIIELEQLALRAQMNPHFIFNSLNSFYQYVINKDLAGASRFMSDFSRLIRMLFETTSLTEIPLEKEITFLRTYLDLEKTKHNDAFSYSFIIEDGLPVEDIIIPSFIIQPFIENSIRHGMQHLDKGKGIITISLVMEAGVLQVTIQDNGAGRKYTAALKDKYIRISNSRGIALTEERISLYNKTHHTEVRFTITDLYHEDKAAGTLVTIYFPQKDIT